MSQSDSQHRSDPAARVAMLGSAVADRLRVDLSLDHTDVVVLLLLAERQPRGIGEIARATQLPIYDLRRLMAALQLRALVRRVPVEPDGPGFGLSDVSSEAVERALAAQERKLETVIHGMGSEHARALLDAVGGGAEPAWASDGPAEPWMYVARLLVQRALAEAPWFTSTGQAAEATYDQSEQLSFELAASLMDAAPLAAVFFDPAFAVLRVSSYLAEQLGADPVTLRGRRLDAVLDQHAAAAEEAAQRSTVERALVTVPVRRQGAVPGAEVDQVAVYPVFKHDEIIAFGAVLVSAAPVLDDAAISCD